MTDTLLPAETATQTPMSDLPEPTATRFRPLRAGILNVWQYDEQEFWFREGRLLLRGENGSGKTKALELLLPFVLDADLSPARLDPFAGTARTMRWNLLENSHDSRLGYVWLEFGRVDDGDPVYATIGAGLRATKGGSGVDSWYFVAEQQRVGRDLRLVDDTRHPIGRRELREQIRGHVFEKATDYRRHLDTLLRTRRRPLRRSTPSDAPTPPAAPVREARSRPALPTPQRQPPTPRHRSDRRALRRLRTPRP